MKTTRKLLIVSLFFLALSSLLAGYLWFYLEDRGEKLLSDLQAVHDRDELEREYKRLQELLAETETERALLEQYVISGEKGTVSFLSLIDEISAELGIDFSTEELAVLTTEEAGFDSLLVEFSFKGSEAKINRLVKILENLPYHSHLTTLELMRTYNNETGVWQTGGSATVELSIKEI